MMQKDIWYCPSCNRKNGWQELDKDEERLSMLRCENQFCRSRFVRLKKMGREERIISIPPNVRFVDWVKRINP